MSQNIQKTLIEFPLKAELNAFILELKEVELHVLPISIGKLSGFEVKEKKWVLAKCGLGKVDAAIHTQYHLSQLKGVNRIICAGVGGGLTSQTQPGSVVLSSKTVEHDFKNKFSSNPPPEFPVDEDIKEKFVPLLSSNFLIGPIASGDEDVVERARAKELVDQFGTLAVAWEGAGCAKVAQFNNLAFAEFRAISDTADEEAPSHFKSNLNQAMKNLAQLLVKVL